MKKKFFSGLFLVILLNVLVKPFYIFGIDAQIQNQVSTEDYGLYFTLLNLTFLFNIVLDIGINNFNTKNIAQHPQVLSRYLGSIVGLRIFLGLIYLSITLGFGLILDFNSFAIHLLFLLALNQFFAGFIFYFRSNFTGMHLFKTDAIFSVLDRLLLIGFCLVLLYTNWFGRVIKIEEFVYAQTLAYGVAAILALFYTLRLKPAKLKIKKLFSYAILKQSAPYALLILLMMLYSRTDVIMMEVLLEDGKKQAGIYAQGFRLLDAVNIFALLFAGILLPIFAKLINQKESITAILKTAAQLLISIAILVGFTGFMLSQELMDLIYLKDTQSSSQSFQWIIVTFIPIATTYIFGTLLTANGSLKQLNYMAFGGLILNLILNYILIPLFKSEGAAFATLITQTITAVAQIFIAIKLFKLKVNLKVVFKLLLFAILTIALLFFLKPFIDLISMLLIIAFFSLIYFIAFKIINIKEIKSYF